MHVSDLTAESTRRVGPSRPARARTLPKAEQFWSEFWLHASRSLDVLLPRRRRAEHPETRYVTHTCRGNGTTHQQTAESSALLDGIANEAGENPACASSSREPWRINPKRERLARPQRDVVSPGPTSARSRASGSGSGGWHATARVASTMPVTSPIPSTAGTT